MASTPRANFSEEQVSAMLAWLLNPSMDHGLGYEFLIKFLDRIDTKGIFADKNFINRLKLCITDKNKNVEIEVFPEHDVTKAIIDIVLIIDKKYYISIENKINVRAVSDEEQLIKQYEGLKSEINENQEVIIVFLVPQVKSEKINITHDNLILDKERNDKKVIITWNDIASDIQDILNKEQNCEISPFNEYLRHTLKALSSFIKGDFKGYIEKPKSYGKMNEKAIGRFSIEEIKKDEQITYVGVQRGESGLKELDNIKLKTLTFQCTKSENPGKFWIKRNEFLELVRNVTEKE